MQELRSLVAAAQAGDLEAYGEIVRRFQDMAFGYAYAILGEFHLAEDASQEAFVEAYRDLSKLSDAAAFPGWFRRIVQRRCGRLRRGKRVPTVPLEAAAGVAASDGDPSRAAEVREIKDAVLEAIAKLPQAERTATTLFYVNGYSQRDIAAFLEVPVGTVKSRLAASRKRLKRRMMTMVADGLQACKPGPDFVKQIKEVIDLRKAGKDADAHRAYKAALDLLKVLQKEKRFEEAVLAHEEIVAAIKADGTYIDMWWSSYSGLAKSYHEAGKSLELAEGILASLPDRPAGEKVGPLGVLLFVAAKAFLAAGKPQRAEQQANKVLAIAETREGSLEAAFWRGEALSQLRSIALERSNPQRAKDLLDEIYENLEACEKRLETAFPGVKGVSHTHDEAARQALRYLGDAYHNLAHHVAFWGWGDKAEALRLLRRADELRDFAPTHIFLARFILSVEHDREAALAQLRKAGEDPQFQGLLKREFAGAPEFSPVREDPEFLAVASL